jgi:carbamoyl-phosphate synthase large subunit
MSEKKHLVDGIKKNILVTGTGGRSVGSGILHAIKRSNADVHSRWNVIAADADPFAWGLYNADDAVLLPRADDESYLPYIRRIIETHQVDAIIPGTEAETNLLLNNAKELAPAVVLGNRKELMPMMMDKFSAHRTLESLGYLTIPTAPLQDWKTIVANYGFPLIVKPTRGTGGSRGVQLVTCEEQMQSVLDVATDRTAPCVQPYIGHADHEYTVGVLTSHDGTLIDSIVMRRKLIGLSLLEGKWLDKTFYAVSTGYSQGFIVRDPAIQEFCETLARDLNSCGPLNIQLRIDSVTNTPMVFEVHPRFSGTTPIRADVGFNEVDVLLRNTLFGERFNRLNYRSDVAAIRAFEHVIVPLEKFLEASQ